MGIGQTSYVIFVIRFIINLFQVYTKLYKIIENTELTYDNGGSGKIVIVST